MFPASRVYSASEGLATTITGDVSHHARAHCLPRPRREVAEWCCGQTAWFPDRVTDRATTLSFNKTVPIARHRARESCRGGPAIGPVDEAGTITPPSRVRDRAITVGNAIAELDPNFGSLGSCQSADAEMPRLTNMQLYPAMYRSHRSPPSPWAFWCPAS